MKHTSKLISQLKRHEGLSLKPYRCTSGKLSVGYGRNLDDKGITEHEADEMLKNDVSFVEGELLKHEWFKDMFGIKGDVRQDVIINMAFNMGVAGLLKFKKMIAAIESEMYDVAAIEMLDSKWAAQVGNRAAELANQMRTGEYVGHN